MGKFDPKVDSDWICAHFSPVLNERGRHMTELEDIQSRIEQVKRARHSSDSPSVKRQRDEIKALTDFETKVRNSETQQKLLWIFAVLVDPLHCQQRIQPIYYVYRSLVDCELLGEIAFCL